MTNILMCTQKTDQQPLPA